MVTTFNLVSSYKDREGLKSSTALEHVTGDLYPCFFIKQKLQSYEGDLYSYSKAKGQSNQLNLNCFSDVIRR